MLATLQSLAAEPASILYMATGVVGFVVAGLRKARRTSSPAASSTAMLFCRSSSRVTLKELDLL